MGKEKRQHDFARSKPNKNQASRIAILCEGTKTEPNYFRQYIKSKGINPKLVTIDDNKNYTDAVSIIDKAMELARNKDFDALYCVYDIEDIYDKLTDAKNRCNRHKNIVLIETSPCFEFWILLHYEYTDRPFSTIQGAKSACDAVIEKIRKHIPDYRKNMKDLYVLVEGKQAEAMKNIELLKKSQSAGQTTPYTTIHVLVKALESFTPCKN